jgi:hypothetical protein
MGATARLRSITDARIEIIPPARRDEAFARMARANGRPILRTVRRHESFRVDPRWTDVAVGLHARVGLTGEESLTGVVAMRERVSLAPVVTSPITPPLAGRVFLIEALAVSDCMLDWRPPVRTLLASVATSLIATVHHDPAYRTMVALRVPQADAYAEQAAAALGGSCCPSELDRAVAEAWGAPRSELRFLDGRSAARAAAQLLDHMSGAITPSQPLPLETTGSCDRMLTVTFPRTLRHLRAELDRVAAGAVDVGWQLPVVPTNDDAEEVRRAG